MMTTIAYWTAILTLLSGLCTLLYLVRHGGSSSPIRRNRPPKAEKLTPQRQGERHWLLGLDGEVVGRVFHLGNRTATIGRKESNHVQVCDMHASRVHCQLTPVNKGILLTDMRSQNGILVNDVALKSGILRDGDVLQICDAKFLYRAEGNYGICQVSAPKRSDEQMHLATLCQSA